METALLPTVVSFADDPRRSAAASSFLAVLEAEQARYLHAIGNARASLDASDAQLAEMSAIQGRLTRRFFDAQRAILEQRARVDDALGQLLAGMTFIAPNNLDAGRFERQLDVLLDEWWSAEQRACAGVVAATPTIADLEPPTSTHDSQLPPSLVEALTAADPDCLDRILDDLVADFRTHVAVAAAAAQPAARPSREQRSAVPFAPPSPNDLVIVGEPADPFQVFWADDAVEVGAVADDTVAASRWPQVAKSVVLPIAGVTAGLAAVMALIG